MRNVALIMSHPDFHWLIFVDFGTTLDLMASEKDNSRVNYRAVIFIFSSAQIGEKLRLKTAKMQLTKQN